ncbi:hypothetical protein E0H71_00340 [Rhizobium leguminosarum bv. viciae]|uniref:hypothetical protein n=1 Tax=Rhizobium leguminosarum TaxID=384 RepID=UPI00103ADCE9|nr:hypothetical protein [Rhizobium leguminosarum]TCA58085.1 hypothetical protein E0H71_00340 [Rhizobium leguminosarum bv. viciae]
MPRNNCTGRAVLIAAVQLLLLSTGSSAQDHHALFEILAKRDPLSCVIHGTETDLCSGPAGAWQVGRLALSVEASAKALAVAGIGFDSRDIQAMIYRDGADSGFDLTLVTPTIAMIDIATLGTSGPFGDNAETIRSLATLSLEALYPGIAVQLGYQELSDLPGAQATGGFSDFPAFVDALGRIKAGQTGPIAFPSFLPVRHSALTQSAPTLQLIPGGHGLSSQTGQPLGGSPNDFLFSHTVNNASPKLKVNSAFSGMPVSIAFTDWVASSFAANGNSQSTALARTPFGGAACLLCKDPAGSPLSGRTLFSAELTTSDFSSQTFEQSSGGQFIDNLANLNQFASSSANATSESGDSNGSSGPGASEKVVKKIGTAAARKGIAAYIGSEIGGKVGEKIAKYGGGGPIGAAIGVFLTSETISCDPGEVSESCGNADADPKPAGSDENGNDPKGTEGDPKGAEKDPKGGGTDPKNTGNDPKTGGKSENSADASAQSSSRSAAGYQVDPEAEDRSTSPPNRPVSGPEGCSPETFSTITYCSNPLYGPDDPSCFADRHGQVGCYGPNVVVESVAAAGPLFVMATVDDQPRMLTLDGSRQGFLVGDVVQATLLAAVDHDSFRLEAFEPIHDGGSPMRAINEILKNQSSDFFNRGFGSHIGIVVDERGGLSLPKLDGSGVRIEGGSLWLDQGFPDATPNLPPQ